MIEKGIRDSHASGQKGYEDRERDHEKNQIDDSGDETNPESCVGQR
jgi:hypothetical protein